MHETLQRLACILTYPRMPTYVRTYIRTYGTMPCISMRATTGFVLFVAAYVRTYVAPRPVHTYDVIKTQCTNALRTYVMVPCDYVRI